MAFISELASPSIGSFAQSLAGNTGTWNYYYSRMKNICMSLFKWENLPETCNARWLEKQLYFRGFAAFVPDPDFGWLSLPVNPVDRINIYSEAIAYNAFGMGYNRIFPLDQIVLVRNNLNCTSCDYVVTQFANRLYNIDRAIDVNINAQKTPVLILTDDKQRMTLKNVYKQYDGNEPVIYGKKGVLNPDDFTVLRTDAPFIADKLAAEKERIWADFLTFAGINSVAYEKKERLISDEVNANNEHTSMMAAVGLMTRQEAARQLNEKLVEQGLAANVRCTMRIKEDFGEMQPKQEEGAEENE